MDKVPQAAGERGTTGVFRWVKNLAAGLHARSVRGPGALLFVIPGGSGGFPSVNVDLYRRNRVFRDSIENTGAIIEKMLGWTAAAAFRGEQEPPATPELERRNELVHHGMTRIALIDQWSAEGIVPDGAVGVSLGEVIAPYAVGAISREDCARLVAVVSQSVTDTPSAYRVYIVDVNGRNGRRLCTNAPVPVDYLGMSSRTLALVISRENDAEAVRGYFGGAIVKEAPSGWPYHTPDMHFAEQWAAGQLPGGIALRPVQRPVYSPAVNGLLPSTTRFDARTVRWIMSGPSHFAEVVSAALADGFDTFVQVTAKPMHVLADVMKTAEEEGRRVRQLHAFDAKALAEIRAMRRRAITRPDPITPAMPELDAGWWRSVREEPHHSAIEQLCEPLLQPLVQRKPFDIVSALADPLADATGADRDTLRQLLASSVLALLQDGGMRRSITIAGTNGTTAAQGQSTPRTVAVTALRALLRLAPDFAVFQPLDTVHRVNGAIQQLVIAR